YAVDWDDAGRSERFDVVDGYSGQVLDSRTISSFRDGVYLRWNVAGYVKVVVTRLAGPDVVVGGLFQDRLNPPLAPSGLTAAGGPGRVDLAWTDNADNEEGFRVERSYDAVHFSEVGATGADATTYADATAAPGVIYYYRVRAYNSWSPSGATGSPAAAAATLPDDPDGGSVPSNTARAAALPAVADTVPPTVAIAAVTPNPRSAPVAAVTLSFSEPVTGLDPTDLSLARDGGPDLLAGGGATLASGDGGATWAVGGLGGVTAADGGYVLTVRAAGSGIVDAAGNGLAAGASVGFVVDRTVPVLVSAASRKAHGSAGTFDLPLALGGDPAGATVEPRTGGPTALVLTFPEAVVVAAPGLLATNANVIGVSAVGSALTVELSGAVDASTVTLDLSNVTDLAGNALAGTATVAVRTLWGDANGSGAVNVNDVNLAKSRSGQALSALNFLADLNASGDVNVNDANIAKSRSGRTVG
ncbi:MAG: cbhB, partial [Phycisphaerales bacterium]|nr:cbhB [Phycisphaerales bacterium]